MVIFFYVDEMLVSVIIPVYNVERYLCECVDCVLRQSYQHLQVVLVDDGSTDDSGVICDNYASQDKRIMVIHKPNGGLSDARNAGLAVATGVYVLFLDADDKWGSTDFVEQLVRKAEQTHADLIMFGSSRFWEGEAAVPEVKFSADDFIGSTEDIFCRLYKKNMFSMSACYKMICREVLQQNGIMFTKGLLGEDMDWVQRLLPCVRTLSFENSVYYCYRRREGSISMGFGTKNAEDFCLILETWKAHWEKKQNKVYLGYLAYLYVTLVYNYYLLNTDDRKMLENRILSLACLLDYSQTLKSHRLLWLKRILGAQGMLFVAGCIGSWRKKTGITR